MNTDPEDPGQDLRERGVDKSNRDFSAFDQVNKPQQYRLSEAADGSESFDEEFVIQTCDMADFFHGGAAGKQGFAQALGSAMEEIGFAILVNHGVDPALFDRADAAVAELFETVPMAERLPYLARRHGSVNQGYFPIKQTTIIHPDLVEGWVFCRRAFNLDGDPDFDPAAYWPRPHYEPLFRELVRAEQALVLPVMQSILAYLGCPTDLYDQRLAASNFGFRLNYYPVPEHGAVASGGRMLGHEDVDLFTFLPAARIEGLQVLNRRNMQWIRLNAPRGSIILNTGDYMQRISNDRLPSTTHRVSQPRDPAARLAPRISTPMAVYVWEDEILEVLPGLGEPKYPPVSAITFHTHTTAKYYGAEYAVDQDK
ncbi:MAG: 2-oxoglutarate and iron-dependent oxygenase domain-containing protein [Lysobacterales bacterium]